LLGTNFEDIIRNTDYRKLQVLFIAAIKAVCPIDPNQKNTKLLLAGFMAGKLKPFLKKDYKTIT